MKKVNAIFFFLLLFLNINIVLAENSQKIHIYDLWINEAPPTATVLVAYVVLKNNSKRLMTLNSVSCPLFSSIEIHRSIIKNDIASMERHSMLEIPSKSTIKLSPGDFHLMLFNPKIPLNTHDTPIFTFSFSDGTQISVTATIRKRKDMTH